MKHFRTLTLAAALVAVAADLPAQFACGDCNLSTGVPNILDALTAAQIAALLVSPMGAQPCSCDVNTAGGITIIDALLIAQAAAGLPVTLGCSMTPCGGGGGGNPPTVDITAPVGGTLNGNVTITLNANDIDGDPLTFTFEFSTNGGALFTLATSAGSGSIATNPAVGVAVPVAGGTFVWDSVANGVGTTGAQSVTFRASVTDGALAANDTTTFMVDNSTPSACTSIACAGMSAGMTGPGTGMFPVTTFTPGPAGDTQFFMINTSGRSAGQSARIDVTNITDDVDLWIANTGVPCGDTTGTNYFAGSAFIGTANETYTLTDAQLTSYGNMVPIAIYHFDPAATANFTVSVTCFTPMVGACTTVTCGQSVMGMTGPGTGLIAPATFTPGAGGDSQAFLLDFSARTAGQWGYVRVRNISDDCDLFIATAPGVTCGSPTGASFAYSESGGLIGLYDEFQNFDSATLTAYGNMVPVWVYHYDPAATATFTIEVGCQNAPTGVCGDVDLTVNRWAVPFTIASGFFLTDTVAIGCGFGGDPGGNDDVVHFIPATTATYTFNFCNAGYDTLVAVRQGDCVTGTEIACNDDACGGALQSEMVSVNLTANQSYFIIVDGWGGDMGPWEMTVTTP